MPMLQFTEKNVKLKKTFSSTTLKHFPFFGKAALEKENTVLPAPVSSLLDSGQAVRRDIKKAPNRGKAVALWELQLQGNKIMPCPRAGFNVLDCLWTIEIGTENPLFVSQERKEVFKEEDKQTRAKTVKDNSWTDSAVLFLLHLTECLLVPMQTEVFCFFCTFLCTFALSFFFTAPVFYTTFCLHCARRLKKPCLPHPSSQSPSASSCQT